MHEIETRIEDVIKKYGLFTYGGFICDFDNMQPVLDTPLPKKAGLVFIIGHAGSNLWPLFIQSNEYKDYLTYNATGNDISDTTDHYSDNEENICRDMKRLNAQNPLDRYIKRIMEAIAKDFKAKVLYPFDGPPYYPFQEWAQISGNVITSPLGIQVHKDYGLWHAYRAALCFSHINHNELETYLSAHKDIPPLDICMRCHDKPCLVSCPVDAFSNYYNGGYYDVDKCMHHVVMDVEKKCQSGGCLARHACPYNGREGYAIEQRQFHMQFFMARKAPK